MSAQGLPGLLWGRLPPSLMDPRLLKASNRYAVYQKMRDSHPVYPDRAANAWVVTGYAEAAAALKDERLQARRLDLMMDALPTAQRKRFAPLFGAVEKFLLFLDAPDHTRIRTLIHKAFTPRHIEAMRHHMQHVVDGLLAPVLEHGHMDVMSQLAYPLPTTVIADMLGVPAKDQPRFRAWTEQLGAFLGDLQPSVELMADGLAAVGGMTRYFRSALRKVRKQPGQDLLSDLSRAEDAGAMLTEDEVLSTAMLLLAAGHETTASLVGSGTWLMLGTPGLQAQMAADAGCVSLAVEEFLRLESPIQVTGRRVAERMELAGQTLNPGELVLIVLGAANRDPREFSGPDTLSLERASTRHLSFSHGPHFCLGAMLARTEAQVVFQAMAQKLDGLRCVDEFPAWRRNLVFRGLMRLNVSL